jgi:hypothetical protein
MMSKPKSRTYIIIGTVILFGLLFLARSVYQSGNKVGSNDTRSEISGPKAKMAVNKTFTFPLADDKSKVLTKIKYSIEAAELRDEIVVQGKRATAVKGRTFLVLTIKIINDFDKAININARDYVRLTTSADPKEFMAADIHNDPVVVQPISTKTTRLGFPINDSDRDLRLHVGEIKGNKEIVKLDLK